MIIAFASCTKDEVAMTGDIHGLVTDADNGEPVKSANVSLNPGGKSTVTGADGRYEFSDLAPGQYTVQVAKNEYESNTKQITVEVGKTVSGDIRLQAAEHDADIEISPNTLNFGTTQTELAVSIKNNGNESAAWSIDLGDNKWISVSSIAGDIGAKKTQSVTFKVDRDKISEAKSVIVLLSANEESYPITINCAPKSADEAKMEILPTTLDFGASSEQLTLTIKNTGEADLYWNIARLDAAYLSVSESSGVISPSGNKAIWVNLNRSSISGDFETTFVINDGTKDEVITVRATKESTSTPGGSGSGDNTGGSVTEDYSSASIDVSDINYLEAQILSCKRSGTTVTLTYTLTNTSSKDMGISFFRNSTSISDDQYNTYTKYQFTLGSKTSGYVDPLYDGDLYSNLPTKATIVIQNVDNNAKKINCIVETSYAWPASVVYSGSFKLLNVPIY